MEMEMSSTTLNMPTINPIAGNKQSHLLKCANSHPLDQWYYMISSSACHISPTTSSTCSTAPAPSQSNIHFFAGYIEIFSSSNSRVVFLVQDWIQTWNSTFFSRSQSGAILDSCPLLYLYSFLSFHHTIWAVTLIISTYVSLVLAYFFISHFLSPEMVVLELLSGFLCLIIAPVMIKGSYSSESTRSPPERCPQSWNRGFTPSHLSKNLSIGNSIYSLLKLCLSCSSTVTILQEEDIEASRFTNIQDPISVPGLYYYLEAMTAFLHSSSCASYSYKPPSQVTLLLKVSFFLSIAFGIFMWLYRSVVFLQFCGSGLNLFHDDDDRPTYCMFMSWEFVFLWCNVLTVISLTALSLMYSTILALLLYTAHLLVSLMRLWIQRYKLLRLGNKQEIEKEFINNNDDTNHESQIEEEMNPPLEGNLAERLEEQRRRKLLCQSLERDAHERYLLIRFFAQEISIRWGPFIGSSLILNAFCCVGGYFYLFITYARYHYIDVFSVIIIFYNAAALLCIVFTVAYANSNVDQLKSHFIQSTEDDYSLIGGRASWLEYIDQTPVYWTVFGFPITTTWIVSLAVTIATGLFGVVGVPFLF